MACFDSEICAVDILDGINFELVVLYLLDGK